MLGYSRSVSLQPLTSPLSYRSSIPPGDPVFRGMRESGQKPGQPESDKEPSGRVLRLREVDVQLKAADLEHICRANEGGLSGCVDDPAHLPSHRRPAEYGGTSPDPVWKILSGALKLPLHAVCDLRPKALICLSRDQTFLEFDNHLRATAADWEML